MYGETWRRDRRHVVLTLFLTFASLAEGNVITIEPGVYVPIDYSYPKHFHGIGIRIEVREMTAFITGINALTSFCGSARTPSHSPKTALWSCPQTHQRRSWMWKALVRIFSDERNA